MLLVLIAALASALAYDNGQGATPPLGWNTWCTMGSCGNINADLLHDVCFEEEIKSVAEAMLNNGMYDLGYRYINLDDCWANPFRAENGSILASPIRFPSGMAALADWMHERDLKLGLYTSAGSTTCSSGGRIFNIPGSFGHYQQDADTFASWGIDYVKIDWCGGHLTNASFQHSEFSAALNSTQRHIFLELCRGYSLPPPPYVAQVAQSWRVTGDHHDVWSSTMTEINALMNQSYMAGPYHWNYADFLMTGGAGCDTLAVGSHCPGQTDTEYQSEFSIWAITQSPLIVATDIRNMTQIMTAALLNQEIIDIHQDTSTPAGDIVWWSACDEASSTTCQIWGRPLPNNAFAAVLFNSGLNEHNITIDFALAGLGDESVAVRDLWAHQTFPGSYQTSFSVNLASHASSFLLLAPANQQ